MEFNPFHLPEGTTKINPTWGPAPADPTAPENAARYSRAVAFIVAHGFGGTTAQFMIELTPIPGFPPPPPIPMVRFSWPKRIDWIEAQDFEDSIHDYRLFLANPSVTLVELQQHFQFGNPFITTIFEPVVPVEWKSDNPPQPENPMGAQFVPGKRYCAVGDVLPAGAPYTASDGTKWIKREKAQMGSAMSRWWEQVG